MLELILKSLGIVSLAGIVLVVVLVLLDEENWIYKEPPEDE